MEETKEEWYARLHTDENKTMLQKNCQDYVMIAEVGSYNDSESKRQCRAFSRTLINYMDCWNGGGELMDLQAYRNLFRPGFLPRDLFR
jgi:hypothetical protein